MLAPGGFDPARDIATITINRWPHGYAYEYNSLWDKFWLDGGTTPCEIARRPFGRIAIANSDAGACLHRLSHRSGVSRGKRTRRVAIKVRWSLKVFTKTSTAVVVADWQGTARPHGSRLSSQTPPTSLPADIPRADRILGAPCLAACDRTLTTGIPCFRLHSSASDSNLLPDASTAHILAHHGPPAGVWGCIELQMLHDGNLNPRHNVCADAGHKSSLASAIAQ